MGEELVAQPFALRRTAHQPGDVDEIQLGRHRRRRLGDPRDGVQPLVRHRHPADIGIDGAERVVRRRRCRGRGQRIEQGRLADIRQADDATLESH